MAAKHKLLGSLRQYFSDYLSAMGARGPFGQLVVKAAHHPELRKRLIDAPNSGAMPGEFVSPANGL